MFVVMSFVLGVTTVWLYAAIRPRFGAAIGTAVCAGSTVWFLAYLFPSTGYAAMGILPVRLVAVGVAWGLGELLIASIAGAWLYTEPATTSVHRAHA